jgi:DNA primase
VVDFYLQILLGEFDLDDTKDKARVVDMLLPVLRAVPNPVEREDYVQKVARTLRVDARAVHSRLRSTERRRTRRQHGPAHAQEEARLRVAEADLESHVLSALLQRPALLLQVNQALRESQLEPVQEHEFQDVGYRAIFDTVEALLAAEHPAPIEALRARIPADLQARLEELLTSNETQLADEQLLRDVIRTVLRLRERSLKRIGQELSLLTTEAQEAGDVRAEQYAAAWLSHTATLLRTQKALGQRWGWTGRRQEDATSVPFTVGPNYR